jgi:hypothetical protein
MVLVWQTTGLPTPLLAFSSCLFGSGLFYRVFLWKSLIMLTRLLLDALNALFGIGLLSTETHLRVLIIILRSHPPVLSMQW